MASVRAEARLLSRRQAQKNEALKSRICRQAEKHV